jgi:UMF1 family MFS transporter
MLCLQRLLKKQDFKIYVFLMEKNNKKVINAWCSYDIANSAYNLIITTAIFPIYYQKVTNIAFKGDIIQFHGHKIINSALYVYAIASAYLVIIFLSPLLSGIADYGGYRKRFMQTFTLLGSISCFLMYWFHGSNIDYGLILVALAVVGYAGSLVFYNSFLPIIATPEHHDKISAKGFSWGYAGSMILLIFNLVTIFYFNFFRIGQLNAIKLSFLEVGIWWFCISQIAFYYLKDYPGKDKIKSKILTRGFKEISKVFSQIRHQQTIKFFLLSFFFFSTGVQTVILVATLFGSQELGISGTKLIITIIIIQILGIVGSSLFAEVSTRKGNKFSISLMLIIWITVCIVAYFIRTEIEFFTLAAAVGLVMGGIQSQARSTYSKLIPLDSTDTASFFSFYDITEKIAIVIGMFCFGFINQLTGSMRNSTLSLAVFFIIALFVLLFSKLPKSVKIVDSNNY